MRSDFKHGFRCGAFAVEPLKGCVTGYDRQSRHLQPKAMGVLVCLAAAAPETLTRHELLEKVWGERIVSDEVLTHAITEVRHALGDDPGNPAYIETIPKQGYRLLKCPRPLEGPGQDQLRDGWTPRMQERGSSGRGFTRRNLVFSVSFVVGTAAILVAVSDFPQWKEDEHLSTDNEIPLDRAGQADLGTDPGQASSRTAVSEALLQAEFLERRATPESSRRAEYLLHQVLSSEPRNALAWLLLGRIYFRQTTMFRSRPVDEGSELARQAIQRALMIDSNLGPAYADLALVSMVPDFDFDQAFMHLRKAQNLSPSDSHVLQAAAMMEMTHAHVGHAIDLLERSVSIDPNSCMAYASLGRAYYFANRLDDAEKSLTRSLTLNPGVVQSRYLLGLVMLAKDSPKPALELMEQEPDEGFRMTGIAIVQFALNEKQASDDAIDSLSRSSNGPKAYHLATVYALRGQHDEALDWLEAAYDQRDEGLLNVLVDPLLFGLQSEARWGRLIEKLNLPHRI